VIDKYLVTAWVDGVGYLQSQWHDLADASENREVNVFPLYSAAIAGQLQLEISHAIKQRPINRCICEEYFLSGIVVLSIQNHSDFL